MAQCNLARPVDRPVLQAERAVDLDREVRDPVVRLNPAARMSQRHAALDQRARLDLPVQHDQAARLARAVPTALPNVGHALVAAPHAHRIQPDVPSRPILRGGGPIT
jgi:hypothetical protein